MKKLMSLLLVLSFMVAVTVYAVEENGLFEENEVGSDGHLTPEIDPGFGPVISVEKELALRNFCLPGWERIPQYRWQHRRQRWEFSGWTCRISRKPFDYRVDQ